jgi:hypothetical protein
MIRIDTRSYKEYKIHFYQDPNDPKITWLDAAEMSAPMNMANDGVMWEIRMGHPFALESHLRKANFGGKRLQFITLEGIKYIAGMYNLPEMQEFISWLETAAGVKQQPEGHHHLTLNTQHSTLKNGA